MSLFSYWLKMFLYAFGSNGSGQLGIGDVKDTCIPRPCELFDGRAWPSPIRRIACGGSHTLALLESGEIYGCGALSYNRAGITLPFDLATKFYPVMVGDTFKLCSALWEASVFVTTNDDVYTLGIGSKGELGMGVGVQQSYQKLDRFCPLDVTIVDLASGIGHSVAVLSNGDVYGWGNGRKGQLGEPADIVWKPRKVLQTDFKVVRAVCGREFTHLLGDPTEGRHSILGADKWNIKSHAPELVSGWKYTGAGWNDIFILTQDQEFYCWGRNDHGQLGPEHKPKVFNYFSAGSEHAVALTEGGVVVCWGWGEHGNCGPGVDSQGDVKGWFNEIPSSKFGNGSRISGIAAGCATTFVWANN